MTFTWHLSVLKEERGYRGEVFGLYGDLFGKSFPGIADTMLRDQEQEDRAEDNNSCAHESLFYSWVQSKHQTVEFVFSCS